MRAASGAAGGAAGRARGAGQRRAPRRLLRLPRRTVIPLGPLNQPVVIEIASQPLCGGSVVGMQDGSAEHIWVRDRLRLGEFAGVLIHEVLHQEAPNFCETAVRRIERRLMTLLLGYRLLREDVARVIADDAAEPLYYGFDREANRCHETVRER